MSSRPTVLLITARAARGTDDDEPLLVAALQEAGADVAVVDWDDDEVDLAAADISVIRSTWDYTDHHADFLAWTRRTAGVTRLRNTPEVISWNSDKIYLADLAAAGVPVVPTTFLRPGDDPGSARPGPENWPEHDEFVVKPAVSAGSRHTARYGRADRARAQRHADELLAAGRTVLLQPYQDAVDLVGETALVFVAGSFSHAARKAALLDPGREAVADKIFSAERMAPTTPSPAELAVARTALAAVPVGRNDLLYARVDLIPGADGRPLLLELELVEPSMFLAYAPVGAAATFAQAILAAAR